MTGFRLVTASLLLLAASSAGCAANTRRARPAVDPAGAPPARTLTATAAPAWPSRSMTLPAGCAITDHTARLAVVSRNTMREWPGAVLGLLDLRTGRYSDVLTMPVSSAERFDVLGRAVSDSWLAWEETSPDEAEWRLYAAPLGAAGAALGRPRLVDSGRSSERGRPLFGIDRDLLVWTCAEGTGDVTVVRALGLPKGRTAEVGRVARGPKAARLIGGTLVLTTEAHDSNASVITLLDARSRRVLDEAAMENVGPVSHFADVAGPLAAWAAYESQDAAWPAVYARDRRGISRIATLGCDPVIRAGRVVFEEYGPGDSPGGLCGADLAAETRFTLVASGPAGSPSWQLCSSATAPGGLLLAWSDELGHGSPGRTEHTLVRVWETE